MIPTLALWIVGAVLSVVFGSYFATQNIGSKVVVDPTAAPRQDLISPPATSTSPAVTAAPRRQSGPSIVDAESAPASRSPKASSTSSSSVSVNTAVSSPAAIAPLPPPGVPPPPGPHIRMIAGPDTVKFAEENSWQIIIDDSIAGKRNYTYLVDWGDTEDFGGFNQYNIPVSVTSFSHRYIKIGTYKALFKVRTPEGIDTIKELAITVEPVSSDAPRIISITPDEGPIGSMVAITGTGFTSTNNIIHFGNGILPPQDSVSGTITFVLPPLLHTYCPPDEKCIQQVGTPGRFMYQILIENENGISPMMPFTVTEY